MVINLVGGLVQSNCLYKQTHVKMDLLQYHSTVNFQCQYCNKKARIGIQHKNNLKFAKIEKFAIK